MLEGAAPGKAIHLVHELPHSPGAQVQGFGLGLVVEGLRGLR